MVPQVEVISRETVKPSSPTPDHLRRYQLSLLDQISPPLFMPMTFFYTPPDSNSKFNHSDISNKLKQSLSENLSRFYPLAGRVKDEFYVDCNDEGVPYIEAKVKGRLSETIRDPVPKELHKLHPYELDDVKDLIVAVQVNFFDCGGVGVSVLISHKVADALSYFHFVNSWAAAARGDGDIVSPQFGADALFPPKNLSGYKSSSGMVKENIATRRFVFSASSVAALRAKYSDDSVTDEYPRRPTRVEALSAFLWTRYMAAIKDEVNPSSIFAVVHAVNLRPRVDPPLPDHFFGNISGTAMSVPCRDSEKESYEVLINPMRDAIRKVNSEYVTKLQEKGNQHLEFLRDSHERFSTGEVVPFAFTSLSRFPLYGADFGWGKPVWVGSGCLTYKNLVVFIDTSSGDGIEAWINLKNADMAKFEKDEELLSLVLPPSP